MKILSLKSVCRKKRKRYKKSPAGIVSGNKAYLSAILDLADKSIISFVLGKRNDNDLVFKTFDLAVEQYPTVTPLFHSTTPKKILCRIQDSSDRGFQYTSPKFKDKLTEFNMTPSMSRVGRCIDNGPMESFWGFIKSEMYYLRKFETFEELEKAVVKYMQYYNER